MEDELRILTAWGLKLLCSLVLWQGVSFVSFARWQQGEQTVVGVAVSILWVSVLL